MKTTILAVMALLCSSLAALAADVSGKWTAEVPGRGGNMQTSTFTFKADGAKLEGNVTSQRQGQPVDTPITEGKVDGDKISFVTVMKFNDNEIKTTYSGSVKGDTIEITRDNGRGGPVTFTAKKAM